METTLTTSDELERNVSSWQLLPCLLKRLEKTSDIEHREVNNGHGTLWEYSVLPDQGLELVRGCRESRVSTIDVAQHCPKDYLIWTRKMPPRPNESRTTSSILISEEENELLAFPHLLRTTS